MKIKKFLLSIILLGKCLFSQAQDTIMFQYDVLWVDSQKITSKSTYLSNNGFTNEEYYYENGSKYMECTRINGELNGIFKKYYPNGQIKELCYHVFGFPAGDWFEYYENGSIKYHGSYLYAPDRLSYTKTYGDTLENQQNYITIEYKISEYKEGCWKYYYPTGKIERIEYYASGKPINTWYFYDKFGNLVNKIKN